MVKFSQKKIIAARLLGEDLEITRKSLNLTLKAIEKKIGVTGYYLAALENGDWELIPGEVYAKNWLKKYVIFLGLDWEEVNKKFEAETNRLDIWPKQGNQRFGVSKKKIVLLPTLLKNIFLVILISLIVLYLGWQIWSLLKPPKVVVLYPQDNFVTYSRKVKILGKVDPGIWVGLNDEELPVDDYGWFKVDINLKTGLNVIKIEAKKSYGRTNTVYQQIVVEEEDI